MQGMFFRKHPLLGILFQACCLFFVITPMIILKLKIFAIILILLGVLFIPVAGQFICLFVWAAAFPTAMHTSRKIILALYILGLVGYIPNILIPSIVATLASHEKWKLVVTIIALCVGIPCTATYIVANERHRQEQLSGANYEEDDVLTIEGVYITPYGTKYHRESCQYVSGKKEPIPLPGAKLKGYTPCSVCNP